MECCANKKKTKRSDDFKKDIIKRINILNGQLNGIKGMVEEDRYCDDILIQLSSIDKSIKSLANKILDDHLHTCVKEHILEGNDEVLDEISDLFRRFQ